MASHRYHQHPIKTLSFSQVHLNVDFHLNRYTITTYSRRNTFVNLVEINEEMSELLDKQVSQAE